MNRYIGPGLEQTSVPMEFGAGNIHQPGSSLNSVLLGFHGSFITQARLIKSWPIGN